jgi:hypothetical protein
MKYTGCYKNTFFKKMIEMNGSTDLSETYASRVEHTWVRMCTERFTDFGWFITQKKISILNIKHRRFVYHWITFSLPESMLYKTFVFLDYG